MNHFCKQKSYKDISSLEKYKNTVQNCYMCHTRKIHSWHILLLSLLFYKKTTMENPKFVEKKW